MKKVIYTLAICALSSSAHASLDESHADFFRKDRALWAGNLEAAVAEMNPKKEQVRKIVAEETRKELGDKWVPVALRIAHVESRFNHKAVGPRTRHGRARGVMQVMPATARKMGFDPNRLNEARYGVLAGVAHMRMCIEHGVKTERQMAACHVAGPMGWQKQLRRSAETYKRQYVAMVMAVRYN